MSLLELAAWLSLAGLAWLWIDGIRAREIAVAAAKSACASEDLQFLDDTAALAKIWPVRDDDGRLRLQRAYGFEYSDTGDNRCPGNVVLIGHRVLAIKVGARPRAVDATLH